MRGKLRPGGRIRLAEQSGLVLLRRMKLLKIYHLDFKAPLTTSFPSQSQLSLSRCDLGQNPSTGGWGSIVEFDEIERGSAPRVRGLIDPQLYIAAKGQTEGKSGVND